MNILKNNYDKILHFLCGLCIAFVIVAATAPIYGIIAVTVLGLAKEVYDYFDYGVFDNKDMLATILGGIAGIAAYYIFKFQIMFQMTN